MTRRAVLASLAGSLLIVGCQSLPEGDLAAAEVLLARGDLLGTIVRLDRVPPAHPDYPRSRALAHATERRVRLSQELVESGLSLRAEWRDREAVERFERALEIWPELDSARLLLDATRARVDALEKLPDVLLDVPSGDVVTTHPVVTSPEAASPLMESAAPEGRPPFSPSGVRNPDRSDSASRLAAIQEKLERGHLEPALVIAESGPLDASPTLQRLVGMLHQRALMRYGHGALELALRDWARVLRLDAAHREAKEFAAAARAELAID